MPFIARWPGKIASGSSSDQPAITLDIMPTLLSLAGVPLPEDRPLDGVDLTPLLLQQKDLPERPFYWASLSNRGGREEALRSGDWKLVVRHPQATPGSFENEVVELYNLKDDPAEEHDLAQEHPERAAAMLRQLKDWYAETQRTATKQPGGW